MRYDADETYKAFNSKLVPTEWPMVGVRIPQLRQMAMEIVKEQRWEEFLQKQPVYYEDIQLHSFVLARAPMSVLARQQKIEQFFPFMDNWAVVDGLCTSLKEVKKQEQVYWDWLQTLRSDTRPYVQRFIFVMYLNYFVKQPYLETVLEQLEQSTDEHYYVHMAVAWALSIAYIKNPEVVMPFLQNTTMPIVNYNKALQKIRESRQIDCETKELLKSMKRRK